MDQTKDNNTTNIPQSEETAKAQPQSQSHEASQTQPQTSYAVRPNRRHHRRLECSGKGTRLSSRQSTTALRPTGRSIMQVKYCLKTLKMYIISSYSFNLATKIRIIFRISNKNVTFAVQFV